MGRGVRGGARVGRAARRVGRLSRVGARWGDPACSAPGFGDILGWRRRRRRTEEAGRLCPSRIFLRSGLAVHNSIAGSPYPKKHSRRAHSSRRRQPPAIAEVRTFPKRLSPSLPSPLPVFHGRISPFPRVLPALPEASVTRLSSAQVPHPQLFNRLCITGGIGAGGVRNVFGEVGKS